MIYIIRVYIYILYMYHDIYIYIYTLYYICVHICIHRQIIAIRHDMIMMHVIMRQLFETRDPRTPRAGRNDLSPMATAMVVLLVLVGHAAGHAMLTVPHSKNNGYPGI